MRPKKPEKPFWSDIDDEIASDYGLYGNHNIEDRHGFNAMRALSPLDNIRHIGRSMRGTGKESLDALLAQEALAHEITEAVIRKIIRGGI